MVDISQIEILVNRYVDCWNRQRPEYKGIYEDNDFGCEGLQIFRNGFEIEKFTHQELCQLSVFLTRSLRGQINRDHKIFWSWCSFLTFQFHGEVQLFQDIDWVHTFMSLVNLLLAGRKRLVAGPEFLHINRKAREYVNNHLLQSGEDKHLLSGPIAFGVLEGLLRRKNRNYVNNDGTISKSFRVVNSRQQIKIFNRGRLNRINDSLRLFEQIVVNDRNRPCSALSSLKDEIARLYPGAGDTYDLINSWRNDLVHGKEFWQNRAPVIVNMICLFAIDEIEPSIYDNKLNEIQKTLEWRRQKEDTLSSKAPWDIFPPDLY